MLDEFYIEKLVKKKFPYKSRFFPTGIGDDSAVLNLKDSSLVVSSDSQVQDVHFNLKNFKPNEISSRALAVSVSDICAMGAEPKFFLNSLFIPRSTKKFFINRLFEGFKFSSDEFGVKLIGGNVSLSASLIIDVTVIGQCINNKFKERGKSKLGDIIYVSGKVGDAANGMTLLRKTRIYNKSEKGLISKYIAPKPKIKLGKILGQIDYLTSMIDVTDGLSIDLNRLLSGSSKSLGALIIWEKIPKTKVNKEFMSDKLFSNNVLGGGDDYELLFTVKRENHDDFKKLIERKKLEVSEIGYVASNKGIKLSRGGRTTTLEIKGFTHRF